MGGVLQSNPAHCINLGEQGKNGLGHNAHETVLFCHEGELNLQVDSATLFAIPWWQETTREN